MKKFFGMGVLSIAAMTLLIGVFAGQKNEFKEAKGYSTSSLPTTIDLNDTSAANIRSYYSSLNNLDTNQRQGTNLLKNLKTILKNGQKYYSYDSGSAIWQIYEIADRDWAKSPASGTRYGTYNSKSNTITGYTYGTSSSSSKNNPYIHALYINRNVNNQVTAWDDHQQTQWGINREHVWPKSQGFEASGTGGARGDPMHLMAGNGYVNNIHSNYFYGYVGNVSTNCGSKYSNVSGNYLGTSKTLGSGTVFEPQDCDKGDIARAIFYMVARYNYYSGSDSDGIDANNPNLELVQNANVLSSYTSTTSNKGKMGVLSDLLAWHHADPVDEYEIHRNNLLYTNYTNNRNPFIDFPEWVDYIWGTATYNGTTYQSYNSTPTGYATPSSDTINGYNSSSGSLQISNTNIGVDVGDTVSLSATSSNGSTISWSSNNTSVATVSTASSASGASVTITGVSEGNATITATATINSVTFTKTCSVSVSSGSSSIEKGTQENPYTVTEAWDLINALSSGDKTTTAYYVTGTVTGNVSYSSKYGSSTFDITDGNKTINAYSISGAVNSTELEGTYVEEGYEVVVGGALINYYNSNTGVTTYEVGYSSAVASSIISATPPITVTSISASVSKTYFVGDTISISDISVIDNNSASVDSFEFEYDNYQFTYEDAASGGALTNKTFEDAILYGDLACDLTVQVQRKAFQAITTSTYSVSYTDLPTSYQTSTDELTAASGVKFIAYNLANYSSKMQFKASGGYFQTAQEMNLKTVTINNRETNPLTVYGSNTANSFSTTITGNNDVYNLTGYKYVKIIKSGSGAAYCSSVTITTGSNETATNVANYIMYEDTNNQCLTKYDVAEEYFEGLSKAERASFMTSDDYVISTARERFEAWALNQGKTINYTGGDYVISSNNISPVLKESDQSIVIVVVSISAISLLAIGMFLLKYKKKED